MFHKGQLRESGTHQALLTQRGIYHRLYRLQFQQEPSAESADRHSRDLDGIARSLAEFRFESRRCTVSPVKRHRRSGDEGIADGHERASRIPGSTGRRPGSRRGAAQICRDATTWLFWRFHAVECLSRDEVARALGAPLDLFLVRKLGTPGHRELAMGAIASGGVRVLNDDVVRWYGISQDAIEAVAREEERELVRRERAYREGREPVPIEGASPFSSTMAWPPVRRCGPRSKR